MKGKWIANQGFVIIQNNTTIKPKIQQGVNPVCFVIIQNNTTIKPEKMGVLTTGSFVIIQNNTTIKQTSR